MSDLERALALAQELGRVPTKRELQRRYQWGGTRANRARKAAESSAELPEWRRLRGGPVPAAEAPQRSSQWTDEGLKGGGRKVEAKGAGRVTTLEELLELADVDLEAWRVARYKVNAWEAARADKHGDGFVVETLHQVTANLEPLAPSPIEERLEALATAAEGALERRGAQARRVAPPRERDGLLLELSVPDLHVGKLAWGAEVGESYDVDLAEAAFRSAVADVLDKARRFPVARALFVVGNDLMHVDSGENTTTKGTRQDVDTRWQRAFERALELMLWAVDELLELDVPVDVLTMPGNHAEVLDRVLGVAIRSAYLRDERVAVDAGPRLRKYVEWGEVLLGFSHGHNERHADLPLIMAEEQREAWGRTSVREWHTGHLHQRRKRRTVVEGLQELTETHGVAVRILPALCPADAWHAGKGYVGNVRAAEAYLWSRERGLEAMLTGHPTETPAEREL